MARLAFFCLLVALAANEARAFPQARAGAVETASRATVFIRVIGDLDVVPGADMPLARRIHRENVELATGSGFIVSSLGQVLTCQHVVADGERSGQVEGRKVKVVTKVTRVEVYVPSAAEGMPAERFEASVQASNADLDLAVLSISGASFPTADLGDSDALEPGDGLDVLGFPFGRDVEIGLPASTPPAAPGISVSHGDFSAFRQDDLGTRRFLQTTASVNPGNSGGPILDSDGYVVGIVSRRLSGTGAAIGFAVPINLVKNFLESNGLDAQLPVRRLSLGSVQSPEGKGIRLNLPWGLADGSPFRTMVESPDIGGLPTIRIDRLLSPWDAVRLAQMLSSGQAFEAFSPLTAPRQKVRAGGGPRLVTGRVSGATAEGSAVRIEYAVLELGAEKLVARYVGPPDVIAFNASVLRASLASLDGDVLRRPANVTPATEWTAITVDGVLAAVRQVVIPAGWVKEPQGPLPCRGLQASPEGVSASPVADFTVSLRVGVVRQAGLTPAAAAAACQGRSVGDAASDYRVSTSWFGANFLVEGRFLPLSEGTLLQWEVVGPADQQPLLRELFRTWTRRLEDSAR